MRNIQLIKCLYLFCRRLISHGLRLASLKTLESQEVTGPFGEVVNRALAHGKSQVIEELCEAKVLGMLPTQVPGYNAHTYDELAAAMQNLKVLEGEKDHPIAEIMGGLTLARHVGENAEEQLDYYLKPDESQLQVPVFASPRKILDPFLLEKKIPLKEALEAHQRRLEKKRKESLRAIFCGAGAAHLRSGPSFSLPALLPTDDELVGRLGEVGDAAPCLVSFDSRRCDSV